MSFSSGRRLPLYILYKNCDKTDCDNYQGISLLSTSNKILSNTILSRLIPYVGKITWDYRHGFQLLITVFTFVRDWRKNWGQWDSIFTVYRLQESLWIGQGGRVNNILTEFGIFMKLLRLIKLYLNKSCSKVHIDKHLSDTFPIWIGLKKDMFHCHCFLTLL